MDYLMRYCEKRMMGLVLAGIFIPCGFLIIPLWLFFVWLSHFLETKKEKRILTEKEDHKQDVIEKIEQYDLVNPGGYTVLKNGSCVFIAGDCPPLPWTCYFEGDSTYGEVTKISNDITGEQAELKHEYWSYENLYSYWKKIYDEEQLQFKEIDKVLLRNGKVDIDARAFRKGKRFIKRDAELLARVLFEEGYIIDYVTATNIGLTIKERGE